MTTSDKEQILQGVGRLTLARLEALVSLCPEPTHSNRSADGYTEPSEWWVDTDRTVRHRLDTSASMSMSGTTITVRLIYSIVDVSS